nr:hypothetical protein [Sphingomonas panacis]
MRPGNLAIDPVNPRKAQDIIAALPIDEKFGKHVLVIPPVQLYILGALNGEGHQRVAIEPEMTALGYVAVRPPYMDAHD